MNDEEFKALCNTYGFAPSRALREMLDSAVGAERRGIWNMLFEYAGRDDLSDSDQSLLKHLADLIRARGNT